MVLNGLTLRAALLGALPLLAGCGAGSLPRADVPDPPATGASTTIQGSQISSGPLDLRELLRGKASGLEFVQEGNVQRIRIRGMSTINQSPEPLILVDNIEVPATQLSSALAGLTNADIRKVDVLKDVASTSSYGMRAAGGVILIYTNRR